MTAMNFKIPEENLPKFREVMARINKRAKKLGFDEISYVVGNSVRTELKAVDENNQFRDVLTNVYPVTVIGEKPQLKGWRFVGKLEHVVGTTDNIVLGDVPSQYNSCPPDCDHCNTSRNRSDTFIVQNIESEDFQQIGRSCLKDFFNGEDPMRHASFLQLLFDAKELAGDMEELGVGSGANYVDALDVLSVTNAVMRVDGYISAAQAEELHCMSTGQTVHGTFVNRKRSYTVTDYDREMAEKIMGWLTSDEIQPRRVESTYIHNLCTFASSGMIPLKRISLFASAVIAHERAIAYAAQQGQDKTSEYVGTIGQKLDSIEISVVAKIFIPGHQYGDKTLYIMKTDAGNRLSWFCSGQEMAAVGDKIHISGTVKDQSIYREVKQTVLQRVVASEDKLFEAIEDRRGKKVIAAMLEQELNLDHRYFRYKGDRMTPLMAACKEGDIATVEMLLKKHVSVDLRDADGNCAIHYAAKSAHTNCLQILQEWGADLSIPDRNGATVQDLLDIERKEIFKSAIRCNVSGVNDSTPLDSFSFQSQFPIAELGKTKKDWEAVIKGDQVLRELQGTQYVSPSDEIFIVNRGDGYDILSGILSLAEQAMSKQAVVSVVLFDRSHEPELVASMDIPRKRKSPRPA